jgi:TrmH family RNA methyltransferase
MITSASNPKIKALRRWIESGELDPARRVPVEGIKLVGEALKSGLSPDGIFLDAEKECSSGIAEILRAAALPGDKVIRLSGRAFRSLADTESPQGLLGIFRLKSFDWQRILARESLVVVAEGIQDPGNLGTLMRTAEAFSADAVLLAGSSVKPFSQKVLRAAAGSVFRLPVFAGRRTAEWLRELKGAQYRLLATTASARLDFREADFRGKTALWVGSEGQGLSEEILSQVPVKIGIPLASPVESLNVAVATAIILCEAARQRGNLTPKHRS